MTSDQRTAVSVIQLLDEQKENEDLYTIRSLGEKNKDYVLATPWRPGNKCTCHMAQVIPVAAIKKLIKSGSSIKCCGRILQLVKIEFDDSYTLTFAEHLAVLNAIRSTPHSKRPKKRRKGRARRSSRVQPLDLVDGRLGTIIGDGNSGETTGGGGTDDGDGDDGEGDDGDGDSSGSGMFSDLPPGECFEACFKFYESQLSPSDNYGDLTAKIHRIINTCNGMCDNPTVGN